MNIGEEMFESNGRNHSGKKLNRIGGFCKASGIRAGTVLGAVESPPFLC